jgi:hypothetical protein
LKRKRITKNEQCKTQKLTSYSTFSKFLFSDYQTKGNVIRELKKKALDKNPEEYYFNMVNTKLKVERFAFLNICSSAIDF